MRAKERQQILLSKIKESKIVDIKELNNLVSLSHSTLQRDLNALEQEGKVLRTYGGVEYTGYKNQITMNEDYFKYNSRQTSHLENKIAIAKKTNELINNKDVVFLTHGTTTMQVVEYLDIDKRITIMTDGIDIVYGLEKRPNVRVLTTGGLVNYASRQIEDNPYLVKTISNINFNKLIMGIGGLSLEKGITFYDYASFSFLGEIIERIDEINVVADSTKFGKVALANFLPLEKVTKVVTDDEIDMKYYDKLASLGVECIISGK